MEEVAKLTPENETNKELYALFLKSIETLEEDDDFEEFEDIGKYFFIMFRNSGSSSFSWSFKVLERKLGRWRFKWWFHWTTKSAKLILDFIDVLFYYNTKLLIFLSTTWKKKTLNWKLINMLVIDGSVIPTLSKNEWNNWLSKPKVSTFIYTL